MKSRELVNLGVPKGEAVRLAQTAVSEASRAGIEKRELPGLLKAVIATPRDYLEHAQFGPLAKQLLDYQEAQASYAARPTPAPFQIWGEEGLEPESIQQMRNACELPISVRGAIMPDAHVGYGLPIGGVLATRNAVIPYAVGVDIACRMKLTVLDIPVTALRGEQKRLVNVLEEETRFGVGATFKRRRDHEVMSEDWNITPITRELHNKAWAQLGTSGSGNHFVEYGTLTVMNSDVGLPVGTYLALLSHSGSRGSGATIADHYSKLAMELHPELPKHLKHLSWLDLDSAEGLEYWEAMELMGKYASANHACIHQHIVKALGAKVLLSVENHHNFAWKEVHDGQEVIVHRKGATPAGPGVLGVIPGSMASPAFIVRGKGNEASLSSAAHGAGRRMSRKKAKETLTWHAAKKLLAERDVTLISAGLDEVPMVYKDIEEVMKAQSDLVEKLARFEPKLVKMAGGDEPAED